MCVCIIDAFLPDNDESLAIHLYFCYLCNCIQIKTNIYISFNDCSSHSDMPPPMPNLRIPVRYREQGRRQQGHLVWRTLGFGDLGRMCGFL